MGFVQHCSTLHCVHTVNQLTFIYINSQQQMAHISLFCKVKKVFKFKVCSLFLVILNNSLFVRGNK